jgi:hypothetical protein
MDTELICGGTDADIPAYREAGFGLVHGVKMQAWSAGLE